MLKQQLISFLLLVTSMWEKVMEGAGGWARGTMEMCSGRGLCLDSFQFLLDFDVMSCGAPVNGAIRGEQSLPPCHVTTSSAGEGVMVGEWTCSSSV